MKSTWFLRRQQHSKQFQASKLIRRYEHTTSLPRREQVICLVGWLKLVKFCFFSFMFTDSASVLLCVAPRFCPPPCGHGQHVYKSVIMGVSHNSQLVATQTLNSDRFTPHLMTTYSSIHSSCLLTGCLHIVMLLFYRQTRDRLARGAGCSCLPVDWFTYMSLSRICRQWAGLSSRGWLQQLTG